MDRHIRNIGQHLTAGDYSTLMLYHRARIRSNAALIDPVRITADMMRGLDPCDTSGMKWQMCLCQSRVIFPGVRLPDGFQCSDINDAGYHLRWQEDIEAKAMWLRALQRGKD